MSPGFIAATRSSASERAWRSASLRKARAAQFTGLRRELSLAAANSIGDRVTKALLSSSSPTSLEMRLIFDSIFSLASQICTPWPCLMLTRPQEFVHCACWCMHARWRNGAQRTVTLRKTVRSASISEMSVKWLAGVELRRGPWGCCLHHQGQKIPQTHPVGTVTQFPRTKQGGRDSSHSLESSTDV